MATANPNIGAIIATTIENRRTELADNITNNTALLFFLQKSGNIDFADGGSEIQEQLMEGEVENVTAYSGSEQLSLEGYDGITAAQFAWKLVAGSIHITGEDEMKNSGRPAMISLIKQRMKALEQSMANFMGRACYADGTGFGGKEPAGLGSLVVTDPTSGTVGGIDRAANPFWRNYSSGLLGALTIATLRTQMIKAWVNTTRNQDTPNVIVAGNTLYSLYMESLQDIQRFSDPDLASRGFKNILYMQTPVLLDGGIGGAADANRMYFLNTKYLHLRPHRERNYVQIGGDRIPMNQDLRARFMGWMGNFTASSLRQQGLIDANP